VKQLFYSGMWRKTDFRVPDFFFHDFMHFLFGPGQISLRTMLNFNLFYVFP
jgi:hypothetical protein